MYAGLGSRSRSIKYQEPEPEPEPEPELEPEPEPEPELEPLKNFKKSGAGAAIKLAGSPALIKPRFL